MSESENVINSNTDAVLLTPPTNNDNKCNISVYYQNVRGLRSKTNDLYNAVCSVDFDILALTETWLSSGALNTELFDARYNIFRCDRKYQQLNCNRRGGVILAVKNTFLVSEVKISGHPIKIDMLCLKISVGHVVLFVLVVYIPPDTSNDEYMEFFEVISGVECFYDSKILIIGDFNVSDYSDVTINRNMPLSEKFLCLTNFINFLNLNQSNSVPNVNNRYLDLVLHSNFLDCSVNKAEEVMLPEDVHHPALVVSFLVKQEKKFNNQRIDNVFYNFRRADFQGLYSHFLNGNWDI